MILCVLLAALIAATPLGAHARPAPGGGDSCPIFVPRPYRAQRPRARGADMPRGRFRADSEATKNAAQGRGGISREEKGREAERRIGGSPHLFVLNGDGRVLQSQDTILLEAGNSYDSNKFRAFLEEWSPK